MTSHQQKHNRGYLWAAVLLFCSLLLISAPANVTAQEETPQPFQAQRLRILPEDISIDVDDTFTIQVQIENVQDLGFLQFELTYDPSIVSVQDVVLGPFLTETESGRVFSAVGPQIDNEQGVLTGGAFSVGTEPGPDGSGVIFEITMTALSDGITALELPKPEVIVQATDTRTIAVAATFGAETTVGVISTPTRTPLPAAVTGTPPTVESTATTDPAATATSTPTTLSATETADPTTPSATSSSPTATGTADANATAATVDPNVTVTATAAPDDTATATSPLETATPQPTATSALSDTPVPSTDTPVPAQATSTVAETPADAPTATPASATAAAEVLTTATATTAVVVVTTQVTTPETEVSLPTAAPVSTPAPAQPTSTLASTFIGIGIIAILLAAGIGGYLLYDHRRRNS
ncbi:MAG: hypothetical protein GY759_10245 [Chloroflexi bacterium]|nr:hypothetical protein [Chloroflexota bacterium]